MDKDGHIIPDGSHEVSVSYVFDEKPVVPGSVSVLKKVPHMLHLEGTVLNTRVKLATVLNTRHIWIESDSVHVKNKETILDDASNYIKELENQVKTLQEELLEISDEDIGKQKTANKEIAKCTINQGPGMEENKVEVEVNPINASKVVIKVLFENKRGVFLKLIEAMSVLGLEVTNINVTPHEGFLLSMIWAEDMDGKMVQKERMKEWLLAAVHCFNV
ncbi:transcription factor ABORTED MICROSPORES-like [Tasmannia lanceolata]|uniref:transcription factor ABORTED MICROSPORES-like n=1 Tax=Tasmannia lanceolata TaxID=3420 RepID=UPI004063DECB